MRTARLYPQWGDTFEKVKTYLALACALVISAPQARGWGRRGHRLVNAAAVRALPEPLRSYFLAHKDYLVAHSIDPDLKARNDPGEEMHHFTEGEAYDSFPFIRFRQEFVDEDRWPRPNELRYGDSVWQIDRLTHRLAQDFRRQDWRAVDYDAVFAAHYAADLTQPLHTVLNFDGQLTGQAGLHARFETGVVNALAGQWVLAARPARDETNLRERIFQEYLASTRKAVLIFGADRNARFGKTYSDPRFFSAFVKLMGPLARRQLEDAASFVGSLWYTAWVEAGQPNLHRWPVSPR